MSRYRELLKQFGIPENVPLDPTSSSVGRKNFIKFIDLVGRNLPEDIPQDLWIKYVTENSSDFFRSLKRSKLDTIDEWINHGFTWSDTAEGHDFWDKLYFKYEHKKLVITYKWQNYNQPLEIKKIII